MKEREFEHGSVRGYKEATDALRCSYDMIASPWLDRGLQGKMSVYPISIHFKLSPKDTQDTQPRDGGRKPELIGTCA